MRDAFRRIGQDLKRRRHVDAYVVAAMASVRTTPEHLRHMATWQVAGSFEYRLLDFNPGFSLVAIDPGRQAGHGHRRVPRLPQRGDRLPPAQRAVVQLLGGAVRPHLARGRARGRRRPVDEGGAVK